MMNRYSQRGLTLIELMIAVLLGALIMAGTVSLFQQSRISSHQDEQIARMQENGRFALRAITRELSMMGYWGGMLDPSVITTNLASIGTDCDTDWVLDLGAALEHTNNATSSPYSGCISNADVRANTDVVAIKRVADQPAVVADAGGTTAGNVVAGVIYLKTNLTEGAMYDANNPTNFGPGGALAPPYEILRYIPEVLYIRPYSAVATDGIPTLVRETLVDDDMIAQPLVDGIENMQIEFGIDGTDADLAPDYYIPNPTATQLQDAVTARVFVLVRSINPVAGYVNDKTYVMGSETVAATNDAFYRRVYSSIVQLRNADKLKLYALN